MKRKIFSKLLMVALVIAAVGSFVSCKDYDDDINNLQKQIDAKAALSELTALQSTLDSKIAAAQTAATAAQAKADAAATKTSVDELKKALETAIADAKKAGTDAGTEAGKAIAAANKAQETADAAAQAAKDADAAAKKALEDALKTIEETYQTKAEAAAVATEAAEALAAVKTIAEAAFTKAEAEKLQEQVDGLKAELETAIDEKIDAKIQEVNNAVASVDAIWGTVTSVELVPSTKSVIGALTIDELYFLKGTEVNNAFGAAVAPAGNAAKPYDGNTIAEIKNYKAGDPVKFDNRVVIRVNPANAAFTADDVVLLNSKGESLNNLLTVAVEPYTKLITRGDFNTGLYVVSVTRKADVTEDDFFKAVGSNNGKKYDAEKNPLVTGKTLYAIGINNSKDAAETRYVNTTFDLGVNYGDYTRQNDFTFQVIDKDNAAHGINTLRNRWNGEQLIGEDQTKEFPVAGTWNAELKWAGKSNDNASVFANHVDTLSVSGQTEAKYRNWVVAADGTDEARYGKDYIVLDADSRTFSIDIDKVIVGTTPLNLVQWYYVTLDRYAAVESAPSEWEAWNSYSYTGLYTVTPAIDRLTVTIESAEAVGDIIGFRVFAVNYDGSLADPDGRAFYVQVGEPASAATATVNARVQANKASAGYAYAATANALYKNLNEAVLPVYNGGITAVTIPAEFKTKNVSFPTATGNFEINATGQNKKVSAKATGKYYLLQDAEGKKAATDWTNFKYIAIDIKEIENILDGATVATDITLQAEDRDHHNKIVNKLAVNVTKDMPNGPKNFSWKTGAPISGSTLILNMHPNAAKGALADTWTAAANYGNFDMSSVVNNVAGTTNYTFEFADANVMNDGTYEKIANPSATSGKKVLVGYDATGAAYAKKNDAANYILALEGPAAAKGTGVLASDTYVNGTKTSGLTVKYTYNEAISLTRKADDSGFNAVTKPTVTVNQPVSSVKFTYETYGTTYRWAKYEYAKAWNAGEVVGVNTVYKVTSWGTSSDYKLKWGVAAGKAFGYATQAKAKPTAEISGNAVDATTGFEYQFNAADAAITGITAYAPWNANADYTFPVGTITLATAAPAALDFTRLLVAELPNETSAAFDPSLLLPVLSADNTTTPVTGKVISANGVQEYFDNTTYNSTNGRITLNTTIVDGPTVPVSSSIIVAGMDCFGQDLKIALPITIEP